MYIYYRDNGEVVSYSEEKYQYGNFNSKKIAITPEIQDKISKGYKMSYNGGLSFEETDKIEEEKKQETLTLLKEISEIKDIEDIKKVLIKLTQ